MMTFHFVLFALFSFVFVPPATVFPFMTKLEEIPFCTVEDEEEDYVQQIGGSGFIKSLPKGVNKVNFTTSFRRCI